jgi:hypothetical protein
MSLTVGSTVGRYQVQGLLGSGGMGEVYKAVDPTLGRAVALKVLRQELSADPERLTRFLHEARAASALNHPNILTIHEVGDHGASRFLVSEFVEGETLRQRLERGPLTLREILDIAIQTASALAAAHAASIVHRDIKPDNLMLRPDGYVKILDFGVATFGRAGTLASADQAATIAPQHETGPGMIVGTIAYMSPEQARGLVVDGRSDCYSLGVVLYELVTGRAPFAAPTTTDLLVAILEREAPPLRLAAKGLPLQLEWIIDKTLEKDPNLRYQTIADLRVDLMRLKTGLESGRLASAAPADSTAAVVDAPIERELSHDSPEVVALSQWSWATAGAAAVAVAAFVAAVSYYHAARPGAEVPLQLPEGAAVTKARDVIESFGYSASGSRTNTEFEGTLDVEDVTALAGLPAARDAIREGLVGEWRVGITQTNAPGSVGTSPAPGDFGVRLDPRGRVVGLSTNLPEQAGLAAPDRARATELGLEALKKTYGADASGYELELITRAFPAGTVEMTWRNPTQRFGHVEVFRVNLRGERLVRIDREFEKPRGYTEPAETVVTRVMQFSGGLLVGGAFVVAWGFGLYVLFKTRNWDALTNRLPLAFCAIMLVQIALGMLDQNPLQSLLGVVAVAVLLAGTVLPALSGVILWMRRRSPERLWAVDELTHGRVARRLASLSLVDGAIAGTAAAAVWILADWAAISITGFVPSISRETQAIDNSMSSIIGGALTESAFQAIGIALAVEVLERWRVHPIPSILIISLGAGLVAGSDQRTILPALPLIAGLAAGVAIAAVTYRRRGLLAAWTACLANALLLQALAARSLEDPELVQRANILFTIVGLLLVVGGWGAASAVRKTPAAAPARPSPSL